MYSRICSSGVRLLGASSVTATIAPEDGPAKDASGGASRPLTLLMVPWEMVPLGVGSAEPESSEGRLGGPLEWEAPPYSSPKSSSITSGWSMSTPISSSWLGSSWLCDLESSLGPSSCPFVDLEPEDLEALDSALEPASAVASSSKSLLDESSSGKGPLPFGPELIGGGVYAFEANGDLEGGSGPGKGSHLDVTESGRSVPG